MENKSRNHTLKYDGNIKLITPMSSPPAAPNRVPNAIANPSGTCISATSKIKKHL